MFVCVFSGDQLYQRGVQGAHADHRHLPEGGVLLPGRRPAGGVPQGDSSLTTTTTHLDLW